MDQFEKEYNQVFISYAHKSGSKLAIKLFEKLKAVKDTPWLDVRSIKIGEEWWPEIEEAISRAYAIIPIITEGVFDREIIKREWVHAKRRGLPCLPVTDDLQILKKAPRWISKQEILEIDFSSKAKDNWEKLLDQLKNPKKRKPIPNMVPPTNYSFIQRKAERRKIIDQFLDAQKANPVFSTIIIHGSPGFGKTTLAQDICQDPEINDAFTGGILYAKLGLGEENILRSLNNIIHALDVNHKAVGDIPIALNKINLLFEGRDCLLLLDDVWCNSHLDHFLALKHCGKLITTRGTRLVFPPNSISIPLEEMNDNEAQQMLSLFIPSDKKKKIQFDVEQREMLRTLCRRLGNWPILIKICGGTIQQRIKHGDDLTSAYKWIQTGLDEFGLTAFDIKEETDRNFALDKSMKLSLGFYSKEKSKLLFDLSIFQKGAFIPDKTIKRLWDVSSGISAFEAERLLLEFGNHFFQYALDKNKNQHFIHFHDVLREYLLEQISDDRKIELHQLILHSYNKDGTPWYGIEDDGYIYDQLAFHLLGAAKGEELYRLITGGETKQDWSEARFADNSGYTNYLKDLEATWNWVKSHQNEELNRSVRLALIFSSIRSYSRNLHPNLLLNLAHNKRWDIGQILNQIPQIPSQEQQSVVLKGIASLLIDEEKQRLAFSIVRNLSDQIARAEAIGLLFPILPNDLQKEALHLIKQLSNESIRVGALFQLVPMLSEEMKDGVFNIFRDIKNKEEKAETLSKTIPYLPNNLKPEFLLEVIQCIPAISDKSLKVEILTTLVAIPELSDDHRIEFVADILNILPDIKTQGFCPGLLVNLFSGLIGIPATDNLQKKTLKAAFRVIRLEANNSSGARALVKLAPLLPSDRLGEALDIAKQITLETWPRAEALIGLSDHFSGDQKKEIIQEAVKAAKDVSDPWNRVHALCIVSDKLKGARKAKILIEMVRTIEEISDESWLVGCIASVASRLESKDSKLNLLKIVENIRNLDLRLEAMNDLINYLEEPLKSKALDEVEVLTEKIDDSGICCLVVSRLVEFLSEPVRQEAISFVFEKACQNLLQKKHEWVSANALKRIISHLTKDTKENILQLAFKIKDENARLVLLTSLTNFFPAEILSVSQFLTDDNDRAELIIKIASKLPVESFGDILSIALKIENEVPLAKVLLALAQEAPEHFIEKIFGIIKNFNLDWQKAEAMMKILLLLPVRLHDKATKTILFTIKNIEEDWIQTDAYLNFIEYVPENQLRNVLSKALEGIRKMENFGRHSDYLVKLAQHLTGDEKQKILEEALDAAKGEHDPRDQIKALNKLMDYLPEALRKEALLASLKTQVQFHFKEEKHAISFFQLITHSSSLSMEDKKKLQSLLHELKNGEEIVQFVTELSKYLPSELKNEVIERAVKSAFDIKYPLHKVDSLLQLSNHLPEEQKTNLIIEALKIISNAEMYVGDDRAHYIERIISLWSDLNYTYSGDISEFLHNIIYDLGHHKRGELYLELLALAPCLNYHSDNNELEKCFFAIRDVAEWWS